MFANTQLSAMSLGFPDACKTPTPAGPIPIPYPNIATSIMAIPNIFNQFITAMPIHNLLTTVPITNGDEAGVAGGVVSQVFINPARHLLGSFKVFNSCAPATKMLSPTGQNGTANNVPGVTLSPSQVKVMVLT